MVIVVAPFMKPAAMTLYPFVLVNKKVLKANLILLQHEQIHLQQQKELLILPFYVIYLLCYLYNLWRFKDHYTAYMQIPFEREAYRHETETDYMARRKFWAWLK